MQQIRGTAIRNLLNLFGICLILEYTKHFPSGVHSSQSEIDLQNTLLWGPGLTSDIVLPARYFEIQLVDKTGNNITNSIGENPFMISVTDNGSRARVWVRTSDRRDGSYVIQYKLYRSFTQLTIDLRLDGEHVGNSPYKLDGPQHQEKCYCPNPSLSSWMEKLSCPAYYSQINSDLSKFPQINMTEAAKEIIGRFNQRSSHSLCHYVVKNNKIYRKPYGEHVGFKMFMDAILLSLTRKVKLPDLEFFVNLGDWPLIKQNAQNPVPLLSWCGSEDTYDIIMPTYDLTESTLETMGRCENASKQSMEMPTFQVSEESLLNSCRVSLDMVSVQGADSPPWEEKLPVAFWRGRDSRRERLELVRLSHKHPQLIDARLTNMFFFKKEDDLGDLVKHISFFDFFKYKYQLNIDGTVAAYRFPYLLGGDAVVFKHDSTYYEHFYHLLKPYEHYIPFKQDLSDLLAQIQWAKDHDEEVHKISLNARKFARENLMAVDVYCYHAVLFKEYASRLTEPIVIHEGMEYVPQPTDHDTSCSCQHEVSQSKEEL